MTEPRQQPERIDLSQADDPRDVVHRAVACLAQGGIVGLASEAAIGLVASALQPGAVERLRRLAGGDESGPLTLLLHGPEEVADWVPHLTDLGRRLARRAWPGSVILRFPGPFDAGLALRLPESVRPHVVKESGISLRVPAHPFLRGVMRLLPAPLAFGHILPVNRSQPETAEAVAPLTEVEMVVDTGPSRAEKAPTIVRIDAAGWEIVHPGAVDAATLTRMAGTILLFVCTGNTCRSPMAEALCKALLAERLGCPIDQLETRGHVVLSAGVAASHGMPAAANAAEVVRDWGGSLQHHSSRQITLELIRHADLILAMTNDHLEALLDQAPECAPRARLLHTQGGDVPDPIGSDRETYQRTAEEIRAHLGHLFDELGI